MLHNYLVMCSSQEIQLEFYMKMMDLGVRNGDYRIMHYQARTVQAALNRVEGESIDGDEFIIQIPTEDKINRLICVLSRNWYE